MIAFSIYGSSVSTHAIQRATTISQSVPDPPSPACVFSVLFISIIFHTLGKTDNCAGRSRNVRCDNRHRALLSTESVGFVRKEEIARMIQKSDWKLVMVLKHHGRKSLRSMRDLLVKKKGGKSQQRILGAESRGLEEKSERKHSTTGVE